MPKSCCFNNGPEIRDQEGYEIDSFAKDKTNFRIASYPCNICIFSTRHLPTKEGTAGSGGMLWFPIAIILFCIYWKTISLFSVFSTHHSLVTEHQRGERDSRLHNINTCRIESFVWINQYPDNHPFIQRSGLLTLFPVFLFSFISTESEIVMEYKSSPFSQFMFFFD